MYVSKKFHFLCSNWESSAALCTHNCVRHCAWQRRPLIQNSEWINEWLTDEGRYRAARAAKYSIEYVDDEKDDDNDDLLSVLGGGVFQVAIKCRQLLGAPSNHP